MKKRFGDIMKMQIGGTKKYSSEQEKLAGSLNMGMRVVGWGLLIFIMGFLAFCGVILF